MQRTSKRMRKSAVFVFTYASFVVAAQERAFLSFAREGPHASHG